MLHSTITSKGQTTIPGAVRDALQMKPGDTLDYAIQGDHVIIRVSPGAAALKGVLASRHGEGMSFDQIREAASKSVRTKRKLK